MTSLVDLAGVPAHEVVLVIAIVAARLLLPLLIPRYPLVIVAVLVLDAVDQTLLSTFTGFDTSESGPYQSVDKGLDIYYLAIAYLATMRNWTGDVVGRSTGCAHGAREPCTVGTIMKGSRADGISGGVAR